MTTRRDRLRKKPTKTHAAATAEAMEAVGGADAAELQAAAADDGATFVSESDRARAHVRGAAKPRRAGNVEIPTAAGDVVVGAPVTLLVGSQRFAAAYVVVEADGVVTSHDARTFAVDARYPEGVQERAYDRDLHERKKVLDNAARIAPEYLVNTNPDSVNGPPVCSVGVVRMVPRLVVVGGNSRAMSLQLAYDHDNAASYRALMVERAAQFGLSSTDFDGFTAPILVRVADMPVNVDMSRALNEAQSLDKSATVDAVSASARLSAESLRILAVDVDADSTIDAWLSSPAARPFVASLLRDRVITPQEAPRYLSGRDLSADGIDQVRRVLVARVLPDAVLVDRLSASLRDSVARALPALLEAAHAGHDIAPDLRAALEDHADAAARKVAVADLDAQGSMFAATAARSRTEVAKTLRTLLLSPRRFVQVVRLFATLALRHPAGQVTMFPEDARSTADLLASALAVVTGE